MSSGCAAPGGVFEPGAACCTSEGKEDAAGSRLQTSERHGIIEPCLSQWRFLDFPVMKPQERVRQRFTGRIKLPRKNGSLLRGECRGRGARVIGRFSRVASSAGFQWGATELGRRRSWFLRRVLSAWGAVHGIRRTARGSLAGFLGVAFLPDADMWFQT